VLAAAAVVGVLLATAIVVPALREDGKSDRTAAATPLDVHADVTNSPPKKLIAAGGVAVSAVYTLKDERRSDGWTVRRREWSVYDPKTGSYEPTDCSWVDVAPGLQKAAVIGGDLPSTQVGIEDLRSGTIRWTTLDHPVAGVAWSPDGSRLVATAYASDPDRFKQTSANSFVPAPRSRTGYVVVDAAGTASPFVALPALPDSATSGPYNPNPRQDLQWSADGRLLVDPAITGRIYHEVDGRAADGPPDSTYIAQTMFPMASPDGRLVISQQSGLPTAVSDRAGKVVGRQPALQLLAWADDSHLVALGGCANPCVGKAEFRGELVLTNVDGTSVRPLSTRRSGNDDDWFWTLTRR
jgi:hypothetical protein